MNPDLCALPPYWIAIVWFGYMCFEAWLGRTDKVKAGSFLGLLFGIFVAAIWAVIQHTWKGKI